MNKLSLYFLLVLVYLGLSKSFAPSEQGTVYVPNEFALPHIFPSAPVTVILTDSFKTGFLIHTYIQRYQIVHVFKENEDIFVRTSQAFWKNNLSNIGMSIFSRDDKTSTSLLTPKVPGLIFIGDPAYGSWEQHESGEKVWTFFNAYRNFPQDFFWGDFLPTQEFHKRALINLEGQRVFYGLNQEFGSEGSITKQELEWEPAIAFSWSEKISKSLSQSWKILTTKKEQKKTDETVNPKKTVAPEKLDPATIEEVKPFLGERPVKTLNDEEMSGENND